MKSLGRWAGSLKIARMDSQFGLYVQAPRSVPLLNGVMLPAYLQPQRLSEKEPAPSIIGNLGEMLFAAYLAKQFKLNPGDIAHLKVCQQPTPDYLARVGPHLQPWFTRSLSDWMPIEIKSRVGKTTKGWRKAAERQLSHYWGNSSVTTVTATPRCGLAVLFRRTDKEARFDVWVYAA